MPDSIETLVAKHLPSWTAYVEAALKDADDMLQELVVIERLKTNVPWTITGLTWDGADSTDGGAAVTQQAVPHFDSADRVSASATIMWDDLGVPEQADIHRPVESAADNVVVAYVESVLEKTLSAIQDVRDDVEASIAWPPRSRLIGDGTVADAAKKSGRADVHPSKGLLARDPQSPNDLTAVVLPAFRSPRVQVLDAPCVLWERCDGGVRIRVVRKFFVKPFVEAIGIRRGPAPPVPAALPAPPAQARNPASPGPDGP